MAKKIMGMYFSPTDTSKTITQTVAKGLASKLGSAESEMDLTRPENRQKQINLTAEDVLVFGFPVYVGRVPALLADTLKQVKGAGTMAVLAAVYGNRDYEDALLEAKNILTDNGFTVIGAGAFIGEHSFTSNVAAGRPDQTDIDCAQSFAEAIAEKITDAAAKAIEVKGNFPYRDGTSIPAIPKTNENCTSCMICADVCPVGAIDKEDPKKTEDKCIACAACVKKCPEKARFFDHEKLLGVVKMLENNCSTRKEPELFL